MVTSCISHPARQRLVILREDYLLLCEGDHCAAALLNFFEHGHNSKLAHQPDAIHANEVAERHGDPASQSTSLLQFHTQSDLESHLLRLYQRSAIRKALTMLTAKGFISTHQNPNPRYRFDKTHYFLFHPEVVQPQLIDLFDESFSSHRREKKHSPSEEKLSRGEEKLSTRSEIPSEIPFQELKNPPLTTFESPQGDAVHVNGAKPYKRVAKKEQRTETYFPTDPEAQEVVRLQVFNETFFAWVKDKNITLDLADQWEQFTMHALARGSKYVDWRLAFMKWLKSPYQATGPPAKKTTQQRQEALRKWAEEGMQESSHGSQ